jgi:hypothetical protein
VSSTISLSFSFPPELRMHVSSLTSARYKFINLIRLHWIIVVLFGEWCELWSSWRILSSGIWRHVVLRSLPPFRSNPRPSYSTPKIEWAGFW